MKPSKKQTGDLMTHIDGIPCQVKVLSYTPYARGRYDGPPEHCYPTQLEEWEWEILDRHGYPAPWLQKKMSEDDSVRIEDELRDGRQSDYEDYQEARAEARCYGAYEYDY